MPFTFSHPALVLPLTCLNKKWFSATGLVIGSMSPDFEYFLRMRIQSNYSHTIDGLFWFDLPLGILLAFLFHNMVRDCLINNLPYFLKGRFSKFLHFNWNKYFKKNWWIVIISILTGAVSHILWDSFTHGDGYFVQKIPALTKSVEVFGHYIPVLKILQHGSTILGGFIIAFFIYRMPLNKNVTKQIDTKYWIVFLILTLLIISIRLLSGLDFKQYGNLIVTGISAVLISLILTPLILKIITKRL